MAGAVRRHRAAIGLGAVVLVVAGAVAWTWRHPHAFHDAGGYSQFQTHGSVGVPVYFGVDGPSATAGRLTISSVGADGLRDSANAEVRFYVCTLGSDVGVGVVGPSEIGELCSALAPADGATMRLDGSQQLLASITTRRPGDVAFRSAEVAYSYGWRRGSQRVGGAVSLHVDD